MGLFKRKKVKTKIVKSTLNKTKKLTNKKSQKGSKTLTSKPKTKNKKHISIGQTLESNDLYLPYKESKKPKSKSRPVIVVDKTKREELMIVPASTKETRNTRYYNKHGIKYYRNVIEIDDNEGKPIKCNNKFKITEKSTKIPEEDILIIKNNVINHSRFASENRKKEAEFEKRKKR